MTARPHQPTRSSEDTGYLSAGPSYICTDVAENGHPWPSPRHADHDTPVRDTPPATPIATDGSGRGCCGGAAGDRRVCTVSRLTKSIHAPGRLSSRFRQE